MFAKFVIIFTLMVINDDVKLNIEEGSYYFVRVYVYSCCRGNDDYGVVIIAIAVMTIKNQNR